MIGCLRTRVRKQPIIALYFEYENELKFYNLEARVWFLYGTDWNFLHYDNGAQYNPTYDDRV